MSWDLRKLAKRMVVLAVLFGIVGGYLGYTRVYLSDERRFWIAINNSMSTKSVTRTLTNGGSGNKVVQDQQFFFAPQMAIKSHVSFAQKTATVDTKVETEGYATPKNQYSRYTAFSTNQKKSDGTVPTLDNVLGQWEISEVPQENQDEARVNYLGELVTLAVYGNYDASTRNELVKELKSTAAYTIDFNNVSIDTKNDKQVRVIPVTVKLKNYATVLQKAFKSAGYGEFPALNPENYNDDSTIKAQFTLDYRNNSIVGITFGTREESYSGYGIATEAKAPEAKYKSGELEKIVQEAIGSVF
jgi:hypothetical protein